MNANNNFSFSLTPEMLVALNNLMNQACPLLNQLANEKIDPSNLNLIQAHCTYLNNTSDNDTNPQHNSISIHTNDCIEIINNNLIVYLESKGNYTIFHLIDGTKKTATKNLKYYFAHLPHPHFFRCHRSYVINTRYILKFHLQKPACLEMKYYKEQIPVSDTFYDDLHSLLDS